MNAWNVSTTLAISIHLPAVDDALYALSEETTNMFVCRVLNKWMGVSTPQSERESKRERECKPTDVMPCVCDPMIITLTNPNSPSIRSSSERDASTLKTTKPGVLF